MTKLAFSLDPKQKALALNLDQTIYGTFAEIGAGQEVARYFFKAGGASGTVAKTMSAYDMAFSDAIYGKEKSGRYVCQSRLEKMLGHEYRLLTERLVDDKYSDRNFFVYANTVAATSFGSQATGHGWMGVRFQVGPNLEPSEVILHVSLKDTSPSHQQDALGVLGTNLIHACYFQNKNYKEFIASLVDNMKQQRIEIDFIKFTGKSFQNWDNRLIGLHMVEQNFTDAVMFDQNGEIVLPSENLYKKNIMATRGSYRPTTLVNVDILDRGLKAFSKDVGKKNIVSVSEITLSNLKASPQSDQKDFLSRVDLLTAIGQRVLVSNFPQYYRLSCYFNKFRPEHIAIVLGGYNFKQIFDEKYSDNLAGGIFESLSLLFRPNVTLYVYPFKGSDGEAITGTTLRVPKDMQHLYQHLIENDSMVDLKPNKELLHIYSRKVLTMIESGEKGWEKMVPVEVAKIIKKKKFFGYKSSKKVA